MNSLTQRLRGSLSRVQKHIAKFYLHLQQRFEANSLISDNWAAMGSDLQVHAESVKKLPPTFWQSLTNQEKDIVAALESVHAYNSKSLPGSLHSCLVLAVDLEEPITLKVYAPLIRQLRIAWTDRATDFYVMVRAHLARIARLIHLYSGDPVLEQKFDLLFQNFEKEVQYPAVAEGREDGRSKKLAAAGKRKGKPARSRQPRTRMAKQKIRSRAKIAKRAKRTKPLVKKLEITRRRAHRR
jgi:hypothetical protein